MKVIAVAFMVAVLAMWTCGCSPKSADADRATARGVILTVAHAVKAMDVLCSQYYAASRDKTVAEECVRAWSIADNALTAAESGVDAWDDAAAGQTACSVMDAVAALRQFSSALEAVQVATPEAAKDALALAEGLKGLCHNGS